MNNKGITLIEIIISIVLISIVLIFLFSLLITVNDINYESEVNSTYLINKSLILKNIEEDFDKANSISISDCDSITDLYASYPNDLTDPNYNTYFQKNGVSDIDLLNKAKCLQIDYEFPDPNNPSNTIPGVGYLGIYYYNTKKEYVISYIRGTHRATRILPEFEKVGINLSMVWQYDVGIYDNGFHNIYIPIIGTDGKDYSLNISYYQN